MTNKKIFVLTITIGLGLAGTLFIATCVFINTSLRQRCILAQDKYHNNCVDSLIKLLDDDQNSYHDRNSAIWALGQLGDAKALPVLNKYYTGNIPNQESLSTNISQYELKKALKLCNGGFNIPALMRNIFML